MRKKTALAILLLFVGTTVKLCGQKFTIPYSDAIIVLSYGVSLSIIAGKVASRITNRLGVHDLITEFFEDFITVVGVLFSVAGTVSALGIKVAGVGISISAFVGLLISFGFKDLLTNISAGAWISVVEPFDIGDRVKVAGYTGTVAEMNATNVVLIGDDGERVVIPAKNVWNTPIVKYPKKS